MTQTFKANGVSLGTSAIRLGTIQGFTTMADLGAVGMSSIVVDNPGGTVTIPAWKLFTDDESAETAGNQRVLTAYITQRRYKRRVGSSLIVGADNEIEVDLSDLNELLTFKLGTGTDANRPSETISARITWLLASTYLTGLVYDNGFVAASAVVMDASDYTGQNPANVIGDCALAAHFNFFVYYDEAAAQASLWFDDSNTSGNWDSGILLSNVLTDINNAAIEAGTASVFYVFNDAEMSSDPTRCYSGVFLPYQKGHVYVTDGTIESNFTGRDGSAPNSNVKTSAAATVVANNFLTDNATEDVRITCTYQPRDIQVNAVLAGQLVQGRFSHFPGYTTPSYFRVLQRSVAQSIEDDTRYQVQMVLSPAAPTFPFTGTAFAELLLAHHDVAGTTWWYTGTGDTPPAGWAGAPLTGPLAYLDTGPSPFGGVEGVGIQVTDTMTVRANLAVHWAEVADTGRTITVYLTKNGVAVANQAFTKGGGLGFWALDFQLNAYDLPVVNGDVFSWLFTDSNSGDSTPFGNVGNDGTYLRVGRGTTALGGGLGTWTGPSA